MVPRLLLAAFVLPAALFAQSPAPQPAQQPTPSTSPGQSGFTLHTEVRVVLSDVTVTDKKGNLVHGLPASAFHVTVDKDPRPLLSFEEHNNAPTEIETTPVAAANTYSNDFLQHLPPVLNVVILDASSIPSITTQMYLGIEFRRFLQQLPADQPLAIYGNTGGHLILVQNFTADHALLQAAADKILPHLHNLGSTTRVVPAPLLFDLAEDLAQVPGHKNVLWFYGYNAETLFAPERLALQDIGSMRKIYDQLEAARISLYPIDTSGVTFVSVNFQHIQMDEAARTTGGQAFSNQNFLKEVAQKILKQDSSFYTLTVSPKDFTADNKWHKLHITVEPSGYTLSYRDGYFADGNNLAPPPIEVKPHHRTLLLPDGKTVDTPADTHSSPIIFTASALPASQPATGPFAESDFTPLHPPVPPKRGDIAYIVRYMLPSDAFAPRILEGHTHVVFEVAALAFSQAGDKIASNGQQVRLTFTADHPKSPICIEQQIDLPKGHLYLYLAVWDSVTGRLGTLQVPSLSISKRVDASFIRVFCR